MVQIVLGAVFIVVWLLGKTSVAAPHADGPHRQDGVVLLMAAAAIAVGSVFTAGLALGSPSSRVRGLALSLAGSSAVVCLGVVAYALLFLAW